MASHHNKFPITNFPSIVYTACLPVSIFSPQLSLQCNFPSFPSAHLPLPLITPSQPLNWHSTDLILFSPLNSSFLSTNISSPQLAFPSHHFPSTPLTSHSFHHTFASPHLFSHLLTDHITCIPLGFHHALLSNHFPLDEHFPHVTLHLWHDLLLTFFSLPLTSLSPAPQLSLLSHHTLSPNLRLTLFLLPLTHCSHHFPT